MHSTTLSLALAYAGAVACASVSAFGADGYCANPALCGDRLVFVSEGDLWTATVPAVGSDSLVAHRLTNGAGLETNPVISPDGTRVAFAGDYEGNRDVYIMPLNGGVPTRLTFHPDPDVPLTWSKDGKRVAFRSPRENPLGHAETFWVDATGGLAEPLGIGECSMLSLGPTSDGDVTKFAFCRWSNENWNWKRYRGGTAPEVWLGDLSAKTFTNISNDTANDLFPMWIDGAVWFASDRDGAMNLWSMKADGSAKKQHTRFVNDATKATDPATYELRWPSADAAGAARIVFAQAAGLCIFDAKDDSVRRLRVELLTDRAGVLPRYVSAIKNASDFSLSPSGDRILIESRGDFVTLPVGKPKSGTQVGTRQVTHESASREWGAVWLSEKELLCVTDSGGEQQLASVTADGSSTPKLVTTDRSQWFMRPVASPDGRFVAFGDKDLTLWLFDVEKRTATQIDRSDAGEIVDYSFSRDGTWLAWSKPMSNANNWITLRSTVDGTSIDVSDGMTNDREPQFDPRGAYLWFLSDRHLNPIVSGPDFEHVFAEMTEVFAVPLKASTPPPSMALAAAAGFDLKKWSEPMSDPTGKHDESKEGDEETEGAEADGGDGAQGEDAGPMTIEADGIRERVWLAPIEPGNHRSLTATAGGVYFLSDPTRGIADVQWPPPPLGEEIATLRHFTVMEGETKEIVEGIAAFAASKDAKRVAWMRDGKFSAHTHGAEKDEVVDPGEVQIAVDPRAEWSQMLEETWRLQRDFYWAPNMAGVDWSAMRERYRALLPKVGTRSEMNDLLGQLISELGTSHTYIMGGDEPDRAKRVGVGVLGIDFRRDGNAVAIGAIIPGRAGDADLISPLGLPHLEVKAGNVLLSIDGRAVKPGRDPYELLQDRAGHPVTLELADDAQGNNRRTIEVIAREEDRSLRYANWVDSNRRKVDELSGGALGYVHVPDMDFEGLIEFSRTFYAQIRKKGMIVDIRDNGGGWISQMILSRIARKPWAYQAPRQGRLESYPTKVMNGPFAILINQDAGSDGDIFPESVRINKIAPLIGTRTWGGVVGIRGDKPTLDLGVTTQPEFAWFDPSKSGLAGWSVENVGVAPDIEVDITPRDRLEKRDPQLAKGVEVLLEELKRSPRPAPALPPYPDRSKVK